MLKRLKPSISAVLMLACSCGGQVVVDHEDRTEEEMLARLCIDYCELARTSSQESCQNYEWCLDRCTGDFAEARAVGCLEEMLEWYACFTATLERGGFCDAGCTNSIAYNACRDAHEGK